MGDTDTTEESGLLMLNQKQKLKPHLGTDTVDITADTDTLTDTDTDTTEENDLLMPNLQLKPKVSHGMDMGTVDMVMDIILTAMDTVVITMDKPLNLNFKNYLEHCFFNLAIFEISLIYLNFKMTV